MPRRPFPPPPRLWWAGRDGRSSKAANHCERGAGRLGQASLPALRLVIAAATVLLAGGALGAPNSKPLPRVINQYALTSANDFPERDPQDWEFLGSNDEQNWVVLDTRKGEVFGERHQRRLFSFSNVQAFSFYKLQIDRVRSPASANAVQLAEIEPGNNAADAPLLTPLFCDVVRAQGENPPAETVLQAFDGRDETKWLDASVNHPQTRSSFVEWGYLDHSGLVLSNAFQLQALRSRAAEGFELRMEGTYVGESGAGEQVCVFDGTGFVEFQNKGLPHFPVGQKVLLSGLSQWLNGRPTVQSPRLEAVGMAAAEAPRRMEIGQPIEAEGYQWVEVEGQVEFWTQGQGTTDFDLTDDDHRMTVHVLHAEAAQKSIPEGAHVRVRGLCGAALGADGNPVAGVLWAAGLNSVAMLDRSNTVNRTQTAATHPVAPTTGSVLTQIDQIRRLSWAELSAPPPVKVRGVVTDPLGCSIQDRTGGIGVVLTNGSGRQIGGLGAYVEIEGRAILTRGRGVNGKGPELAADHVRLLGNGLLPNPLRPSWSVLASGQMDAQWVEVDGVVRATDGSHLLLACESGQLMATLRTAPVSVITNLVDTSVRLRGVSFVANDAKGQFQGVALLVPSLSFLQILQPPADLARLQTRDISTLRQIRGPGQLIHRVKIHGLITGNDGNRYFVQDETGGVTAMAREEVELRLHAGEWWTFWQTPRTGPSSANGASPHVGDAVEVVGFPEIRGYAPILTEAVLRKTNPLKAVAPVRTSAEELSQGGLDATLVALEGVVQGSERLGKLLIFHVQSGLRTFRAILPLEGKEQVAVAPGTRVQVTGVCQVEPEPYSELGRSPLSFALRLRDASDLRVLGLPPWLSLRRALLAVGVMILILLAAFAWIRLLHRQVALRTRQLEENIAEHERTERLLASKTQLLEEEIEQRKRVQSEVEKIHKQLMTTSRMAGMADVATNVLHNVGNVLNSVNVLAASIAAHVRKSRVAGVSRLAGLLHEHQADLGHFLTEHPDGCSVPAHLQRLGAHLSDEQSSLLDKIKSLSESVQHIREIVAMQQNYSKVCGLRETASIADIVEDALRMCSNGLARHEISFTRNYEEIPPLILDRHKTLQILFNLLDNAKQACWESGRDDKRICVGISRPGQDRVRIEVIDNGVGIRPEHAGRIFTQGFSTRKGGHGFGLHSSILAAQDMGGSLRVRSAGPGAGAAFTLEIPFTHASEAVLVAAH